MGQVIEEQITFFLQAIVVGMGLRSCYDLFLIARCIKKHGSWVMGIEDFFYWMGCGIIVFSLLYEKNDGVIRGFVLIGVFLGMFIYHKGPSGYLVKGGYGLYQVICKIWKIVTMPLRLVVKVCRKIWQKYLQKYKNCFKLKFRARKQKQEEFRYGKENQPKKKKSPRYQRIRKKVR